MNLFGDELGLVGSSSYCLVGTHIPGQEQREKYFRSLRKGRLTASKSAAVFIKDLPAGLKWHSSKDSIIAQNLWENTAAKLMRDGMKDIPQPSEAVNDFMLRGKALEGDGLALLREQLKCDLELDVAHFTINSMDENGIVMVATPDAVWSSTFLRANGLKALKGEKNHFWMNVELKTPALQPVEKPIAREPEHLWQVIVNAAALNAAAGWGRKEQLSLYARYDGRENLYKELIAFNVDACSQLQDMIMSRGQKVKNFMHDALDDQSFLDGFLLLAQKEAEEKECMGYFREKAKEFDGERIKYTELLDVAAASKADPKQMLLEWLQAAAPTTQQSEDE